MGTSPRTPLLETSALIVGYAMSRLDKVYLEAFHLKTWKQAFHQAGEALRVAPASIKNLRDEFDPVHGNARRGWRDRPMRPNRQRIMGELCDVSDAALMEMIHRILEHDRDAVQEVVIPLSRPSAHIHNVAERLRTGRMAEEFFLRHSQGIANFGRSLILDHRDLARGYDFGVRNRSEIAIEVKGLKERRGGIVFTDREWSEANARRDNYWLVVVGNLEASPRARLFPDPATTITAQCRYQTTISACWRATVDVG